MPCGRGTQTHVGNSHSGAHGLVLCPQALFMSINAMLLGVWILLLLADLWRPLVSVLLEKIQA